MQTSSNSAYVIINFVEILISLSVKGSFPSASVADAPVDRLTAAPAAGAWAHLTGELVVCAGNCGPGNTHLINGLYDCGQNRLPVLAIAAQIPSKKVGSGYFQETRADF